MFKFLLIYLFAILVAVQPIAAAVDFHVQDLNENHQGVHQTLVDNAKLPLSKISLIDVSEQTSAFTITAEHTNDHHNSENHKECHQGHCHHSSIVFLVKLENNKALKWLTGNQLSFGFIFDSLAISPGLRPPIV